VVEGPARLQPQDRQIQGHEGFVEDVAQDYSGWLSDHGLWLRDKGLAEGACSRRRIARATGTALNNDARLDAKVCLGVGHVKYVMSEQ
jgi:hypothetical protein